MNHNEIVGWEIMKNFLNYYVLWLMDDEMIAEINLEEHY